MHRQGVLVPTIDFREDKHPIAKYFYMPSLNGPVQKCPHGLDLKNEAKESKRCKFCHAKLFSNETSNLCCANGQIVLGGKYWQMKTITPPPQLIKDLFGGSDLAKEYHDPHFKRNIRKYNNACAMVCVFSKLDKKIHFYYLYVQVPS